MDAVESQVVETPPDELSELAKAMLGAQAEKPAKVPAADPEMETPEAEPVPEPAPDDPEAPETEPAPKSIKALAEKLGVETSELYDIKLSMPDGTELSLGALKDQYQDIQTLTTEREALDERRIAFDTEISAKTSELEALAQVVDPSRITAEEKQAYNTFVEQQLARESKLLLQTTPEWADPIQREADLKLMLEHAGKFGMSEGELRSIKSHTVIRMIRDAALKGQRVAKTPPKGQKPTVKPTAKRNDLQKTVSDFKAGKISQKEALGNVLRAKG